MSTIGGGNLVTNGLVFCIDGSNPKSISKADLFINGVKVGSTYTITVARDTTLNRIQTSNPYLLIKTIAFFPYTLSNAQCQNLTT